MWFPRPARALTLIASCLAIVGASTAPVGASHTDPDGSGPAITVTSPTVGDPDGPTIDFEGRATDPDGVVAVRLFVIDLVTRQTWDGTAWTDARTDFAAATQGSDHSAEPVSALFVASVPRPANPVWMAARAQDGSWQYGPSWSLQLAAPDESTAPPAPAPAPPADSPAPVGSGPASASGGGSVDDSSDPTVVRDPDKPATVITRPTSIVHDGGNLVIAGTASDPDGVVRVELTVRELVDRRYYNGAEFDEAFAIVRADLSNPGGTSTEWSITVPTPRAPIYLAARGVDRTSTYGDFVTFQTDVADSADAASPVASEEPPAVLPRVDPGGSADLSPAALCAGPVRVGVAVDLYSHNPSAATYSAAYDELVDTEFCHISSENSLKRSYLQTDQGVTDHGIADSFAATAQRHGSTSRGHSLVWNYRDPAYIGELSAAGIRADLTNFISTTMTRLPSVDHWDVVNEPLDWGGRGFWSGVYDRLESGGYPTVDPVTGRTRAPNFVVESFEIADQVRQANGLDTALWLNESNVLDPENAKYGFKAEALYQMTKWMVETGVPVDGVGFQAHLRTPGLTPRTVWGSNYEVPVLTRATAPAICANLLRYRALGLDVALTEADIVVPLDATPAQLRDQIEGYKLLYQVAAEVGASDLTIWGLGDGFSFYEKLLDGAFVVPGYGQATLFDRQLRPKAVYRELAAFIEAYAAGDRPAPVC